YRPETQNARADHTSSFWLVPDPTFLYHPRRFSQCRRQPRRVSGNVPFSIIFFSTRCMISSTLSSPISPASPFSIVALRVLNFSSRSRSRRIRSFMISVLLEYSLLATFALSQSSFGGVTLTDCFVIV